MGLLAQGFRYIILARCQTKELKREAKELPSIGTYLSSEGADRIRPSFRMETLQSVLVSLGKYIHLSQAAAGCLLSQWDGTVDQLKVLPFGLSTARGLSLIWVVGTFPKTCGFNLFQYLDDSLFGRQGAVWISQWIPCIKNIPWSSGSEDCALSLHPFLHSPRIIMLCHHFLTMKEDHFSGICYGTKWSLCANVPLNPHYLTPPQHFRIREEGRRQCPRLSWKILEGCLT